jgi:amidophosphoribosyltransferase
MSTIDELFAAKYAPDGQLNEDVLQKMAADLGADSLRYLPVESVARAIGFKGDELCQACITGRYPTPWGQKLYNIAVENARNGDTSCRTYESRIVETGCQSLESKL